jgi:hypothetical protein
MQNELMQNEKCGAVCCGLEVVQLFSIVHFAFKILHFAFSNKKGMPVRHPSRGVCIGVGA